ncbi:MAG: putative glycosyltransferase [Elusimicrobia bacterium]|nr:putative glycosyltransferase [Elusimicrobiota bacterium]
MVVTVIIPALNEAGALPLVLAEIPRAHVDDIIVVDNGSTDPTALVAREGGARVFQVLKRGYGRAVQCGLKNLKPECDTVVILDADHSDFPEELPKLLDPIERGELDFVIGSRTEAALPGSLMPQQRFGNWLACFFIRLLYGQRFTDMGPFRALRRSTIEALKLKEPTFGWNVEMQLKALKMGFRVGEVPVRYRPRIGQSKISGTLRGSLQASVIILRSLWKYH